MTETPIAESDFAALFAPFGAACVAVAVSGGPDSMALAFCLKRALGAANVTALIVEHGLREESAQEAKDVAARLEAMGIETEILPWVHDEIANRVHVQARQARYALLIESCQRREIDTLCLAHHADDQAETVLMRLAKGSGIDGLAGMETLSEMDGVRIVRPFLTLPKARLVATCEANSVVYVRDPSNEKEKYARGRLRRVMPLLVEEGLTRESLLDLADRAREAKEALDHYTTAFLREATTQIIGGAIKLDLSLFEGAPDAIRLRALDACLRALVSAPYPIERKQLVSLMAWLLAGDGGDGGTTRSLHGCLLSMGEGAVTILREAAAITEEAPIAEGETILWDQRWRVTLAPHAGKGLCVRALGIQPHEILDTLAPALRKAIASGRVRAALPSLWRDGVLVAIPDFSKEEQTVVQAERMPLPWK